MRITELHKEFMAEVSKLRYDRFLTEHSAHAVMFGADFKGVKFTNVTDLDCMTAYKALLVALKSSVDREIKALEPNEEVTPAIFANGPKYFSPCFSNPLKVKE